MWTRLFDASHGPPPRARRGLARSSEGRGRPGSNGRETRWGSSRWSGPGRQPSLHPPTSNSEEDESRRGRGHGGHGAPREGSAEEGAFPHARGSGLRHEDPRGEAINLPCGVAYLESDGVGPSIGVGATRGQGARPEGVPDPIPVEVPALLESRRGILGIAGGTGIESELPAAFARGRICDERTDGRAVGRRQRAHEREVVARVPTEDEVRVPNSVPARAGGLGRAGTLVDARVARPEVAPEGVRRVPVVLPEGLPAGVRVIRENVVVKQVPRRGGYRDRDLDVGDRVRRDPRVPRAAEPDARIRRSDVVSFDEGTIRSGDPYPEVPG